MKPSNSTKMNKGFTHYLQSQQKSTRTIRAIEKQVKLFLAWLDKEGLEAEQARYQDLLLYLKHCQQKNLTQRTIQNYLNHIRHYFDYLEAEGRITHNPAAGIEIKGIKRKKLYHTLEPTELHQLYNSYPTATLKDKRNKVILGLLVYQGLRTEELSKLEVQDVKLREGKIEVQGGRRSNTRTLKLEPQQVMDMYDYVLQVRPRLVEMKPKRTYQEKATTALLFIAEGGRYYSFSNFITQMMIKARKLNQHLLNAKQIRASVIIKWLKIYNLREVQYRAGHRYVSSTEGYLQSDMEGLQEEINQYHPL